MSGHDHQSPPRARGVNRPRVEILYVDGCPNFKATRALVERVAGQLRVDPEIELVEVRDVEAASTLRFPGSPTVRVNGRDVDPSAADREEIAFSCRLYRCPRGISGQPDASWIHDALAGGPE